MKMAPIVVLQPQYKSFKHMSVYTGNCIDCLEIRNDFCQWRMYFQTLQQQVRWLGRCSVEHNQLTCLSRLSLLNSTFILYYLSCFSDDKKGIQPLQHLLEKSPISSPLGTQR